MNKNQDITIVLSGAAGQGLKSAEIILIYSLKNNGYNVFSSKEYMSRIRGGNNTTLIRVSSEKIAAYIERIDILVLLNKGAVKRLKNRISKKTLIICDPEYIDSDIKKHTNVIELPFNKNAKDLGSPLYSITITAGVILGILNCKKNYPEEQISKIFMNKDSSIIKGNISALDIGYKLAENLEDKYKFKLQNNIRIQNEYLLTGTDAISIGAIAGGCNFISSYPMSPSTGVLLFLSEKSDEFGVIVEQAEDEISAINMALGAWYAGAKAIVTTSGGGFALMEEGISLAGMIESPVVIHLAQRPGPATGLPTRTEQGDLNLALYSGHGEFPKVLYAPGNVEEAYELTKKAFYVADKYQVPVIIITDQYLLDSYVNITGLDLESITYENFFIKTNKNYKRYKLTDTGISPRGIPGYGKGIVCVDSDEHDEEGHITEDLDLRKTMVDKRLNKLKLILNDTVPPKLLGNKDFKILVVSWGSNYSVIKESLKEIHDPSVAFLHFNQLYPLHKRINKILKKAEKIVIIENNATAQFANLLEQEMRIRIDTKILKYNGMPFSVEEIVYKLRSVIRKHSN